MGVLLGWLLKAGMTELAARIWVSTKGLCLPKDVWDVVHGLLYGRIRKAGYHGHIRAMV